MIPHIKLPFQFVGSAVAVVDQDTPDEVLQCAITVLRYVPGQRPELPEFGVPDQAFKNPPNTEEMRDALARFEPRAAAGISNDFVLDSLTSRIKLTVEATG